LLLASVWQDAAVDAVRKKQFAHLAAAKSQVLTWAAGHGVPLVRVEFVVPLVETDFGIHVWLFYDHDADVGRLGHDGGTQLLQDEFVRLLRGDGYPAEWLSGVALTFDSDENVVRHYEGSYFHRLR
jgi:hypothetical protein